jgi:hypothetical protein
MLNAWAASGESRKSRGLTRAAYIQAKMQKAQE